MQLPKSIAVEVQVAVEECKKKIVKNTLKLCYEIDKKKTGEIKFECPVFLPTTHKRRKATVSFNTEFTVANGLTFGYDHLSFYCLTFNGETADFSQSLSLSNLKTVFDAVALTAKHM